MHLADGHIRKEDVRLRERRPISRGRRSASARRSEEPFPRSVLRGEGEDERAGGRLRISGGRASAETGTESSFFPGCSWERGGREPSRAAAAAPTGNASHPLDGRSPFGPVASSHVGDEDYPSLSLSQHLLPPSLCHFLSPTLFPSFGPFLYLFIFTSGFSTRF